MLRLIELIILILFLKLASVCLFIYLAASYDWDLHQLCEMREEKNAFLID